MFFIYDNIATGTLYKWAGEVGVYMAENPDSKLEFSNNRQISLLGPYIQPGDVLLYVGPAKCNPDIRLFLYKETLTALHVKTLDEFIRHKHLLSIAGVEI